MHMSSESRVIPGRVVPMSERNGGGAHHVPVRPVRPRLGRVRRGGLAAALLLLPLLAGLAPAAGADVPYYLLPKVGLKGGPPVTEGEPMTFTLRITPVQTKDVVVPVLVYRLGTSETFDITIPANKREIVGSVPTVDNDVHESDRWYQLTPQIGPSYGTRTDVSYGAYARMLVKDNDSGSRPVVSIESQAQVLAESEGEWNWIMEGDIANFTIKTDETIKVDDTGVAREAFTACVSVRDSHTGRGGDFLAPQHEGNQCVTLPAGESSVTLSLPTVDDDRAESWDYIVVDLLHGSGYLRQQASPLYLKVFDNDSACPATWPYLIYQVRGYYKADRNRADRGYGRNWLRVLRAYGTPNYYAVSDYATLKPFTAAEARAREAVWSGWAQVRQELERIETCARHGGVAGRHYPLTAPTVPEITLSGGSPVTEGGDATFTLTATPAPASELSVSVTVTATGDYGVTTGTRTVTIPTTGSAPLTVATEGDEADEPNGSVTLTLNAGDGYAVGAPSSLTADILDDDPPAEAQLSPASSPACAPSAAALVQEVRRYYELNRRRADRNHGENWRRVLIAFGAETHATLTPYTATEARASERIWSGWRPVRIELERLEACAAPVVAAAQQAEPAPQETPAVTLSAGAPITEGGAATFTLTATPAPTSDIDISVTLTETGRFATSGATGPRTVTLGPSGTATLTVATDDDTTDEPDGAIAVTVTAGAGYTAGEAATARVAVADNDPTPLTVAVDDATAREGTEMAFTVRLSAPAPDLTIVYARTRETTPVSAMEGVDYQPRSRISVAIFREGDTVQTLTVPTMHDAHDDGGETFELVLTRATPARHDAPFALSIADAVGVGTITNADPLPAAYLARFGRTVAEQALEGIARRLTAPRTPGVQGTLAGTALGAAPDAGPTFAARGLGAESPSPGAQDPDPLGDPFGFNRPPGHAPTMTAREALLGSHFSLTGARDATGGSLAAWGRASAHHFDGAARGDGTAITLDATVTTALIGADYARDDWLLGLALTHSTSEGDYASLGDNPCAPPPTSVLCDAAVRAGTGTLDASLTAAVPYAALEATPRLKLWGAAGLGTGEVTVKTQHQRYRADTEWTMAAAGARSTLLDAPPATAGPTLALTADALWTRTASERTAALAASDSDVTRLRLGLEGSWHIAMADAARLVPTLALGARHDGGDAETGAGVELGAGLAWSAPALGLSLDLSGRTLIAHEDDDLEDRGVSAALAFDPDPATERGAAFSVRQDVGGPAEGGLEALFTPAPLADRPGREARAHWTLEAAYGLPALGGRFTASPHAAVGLAPDTRDYTLGWRLTPHAATAPDLTVGLRATRHEPASTPPVHTLGVEATVRW